MACLKKYVSSSRPVVIQFFCLDCSKKKKRERERNEFEASTDATFKSCILGEEVRSVRIAMISVLLRIFAIPPLLGRHRGSRRGCGDAWAAGSPAWPDSPRIVSSWGSTETSPFCWMKDLVSRKPLHVPGSGWDRRNPELPRGCRGRTCRPGTRRWWHSC